jgi:hypothetical protein
VRQWPEKLRPVYVSIPRSLFEQIKNVTLTADVMFVNGLPFFVTLSRGIKLVSAQFLPSRTVEQLCNALRKVITVYRRGRYAVRACLMDMEFEPLVDSMEEVVINTTAAREHVGDVERKTREIKEWGRSTVSELPYRHCMPDQAIIHLIYFVVLWINGFSSGNGVSEIYSPREIVTGMKLDFTKHCKVQFGAYVEASFDDEITNTLKERTHSCISLGTSGNVQGSIKCLDLETGRVVKRRTVNVLPMPERVIERMIKLGKKCRQSRSADTLQFLNRHKEKYDWDNEDLEVEEGLVEDEPYPDLLAELPGCVWNQIMNLMKLWR